jgi:hypothetical protein
MTSIYEKTVVSVVTGILMLMNNVNPMMIVQKDYFVVDVLVWNGDRCVI